MSWTWKPKKILEKLQRYNNSVNKRLINLENDKNLLKKLIEAINVHFLEKVNELIINKRRMILVAELLFHPLKTFKNGISAGSEVDSEMWCGRIRAVGQQQDNEVVMQIKTHMNIHLPEKLQDTRT